MTDATMLERAARAARDDAAIYGADLTVDQAAHVARAVLMAVREPSRTEQVWMMDGRLTNCSPEVAEGWRQEYERNWRAMIDAILADGEGR